MPKVIIINIPMMYPCVLHVQSISLMSAASTAFIRCIAMFATKAFNLDVPYSIYIIISVIISVISMTVNAHQLGNCLEMIEILSYLLVYLNSVLSYQGYSFYFCIELLNLAMFSEHSSN